MKRVIIAALFLTMPWIAFAADNAKRETVEQLLEVMKTEQTIDAMYAQMDQLFLSVAKQLGVKESEQPIVDRYMTRVAAAMKEEMTWKKMKEPMIDIYIKHYSEKEIKDLLAFYKTESGQAVINKMPLVMKDSMLISQNMMKGFMPRMKELAQELKQDLAEARSEK